jgi:hypothetical protein
MRGDLDHAIAPTAIISEFLLASSLRQPRATYHLMALETFDALNRFVPDNAIGA